MLQSFGTELAERELPDEGKAIERLLEIHTDKYRKLKVRLHINSIYYSYILHISVDFAYQTLKGCNQVSFKGRPSSSCQPGSNWKGGCLSVGREAGLGNGTKVRKCCACWFENCFNLL